MNNENNNNNNDMDLFNLYGATPSEPEHNEPVNQPVQETASNTNNNVVPQPVEAEPVQQNINNDQMNSQVIPQPEKPLPSNNSNKNTGSILLIVGLIIIGFVVYNFFFNKNDQLTNSTDKDGTKEVIGSEQTNKKEMIKIFKNYTEKIETYAKSNEYHCKEGEMILPTRFIIEIDTSTGESRAQKNAELIGANKSPWGKDIKGYIIVEKQIRGDSLFNVNLSDGNYGVSNEIEINDLKEKDIVSNISYPSSPETGIKCQLGGGVGYEEE